MPPSELVRFGLVVRGCATRRMMAEGRGEAYTLPSPGHGSGAQRPSSYVGRPALDGRRCCPLARCARASARSHQQGSTTASGSSGCASSVTAARAARSSRKHWRLVGWEMTLKDLAKRMRCSKCGKKAAEVVAVAKPAPAGMSKDPN
jgi:hypothetical protein